jgi:hypothetical protein
MSSPRLIDLVTGYWGACAKENKEDSGRFGAEAPLLARRRLRRSNALLHPNAEKLSRSDKRLVA